MKSDIVVNSTRCNHFFFDIHSIEEISMKIIYMEFIENFMQVHDQHPHKLSSQPQHRKELLERLE